MKGVDELVVGCGDREQEGARVGPGFQPGWFDGWWGPLLWWVLRRRVVLAKLPACFSWPRGSIDKGYSWVAFPLLLLWLHLAEMQLWWPVGLIHWEPQSSIPCPDPSLCTGSSRSTHIVATMEDTLPFALVSITMKPALVPPLAFPQHSTFLSLKHGVLTHWFYRRYLDETAWHSHCFF